MPCMAIYEYVGNSSKKTDNKFPFHGIQELGGDDSTFDWDLYMQINNLAITHDTGQFALRDTFLVQEDIPTLSEVPIDYFTTIIERKIGWKTRVKRDLDGRVFLQESSVGRIDRSSVFCSSLDRYIGQHIDW